MKTHTITRWFDETSKQYVVSFADYTGLHLKLVIAEKALRFYTNAANWEHDFHPSRGHCLIMLNEKDTTLADGKIVGGFIAKMALDDLESAGEL